MAILTILQGENEKWYRDVPFTDQRMEKCDFRFLHFQWLRPLKMAVHP
ncbi:MAG: hypothetical protein KJ558_07940 [Gammaproteobacteria bacterium]|nr:hypothetical protein [Gammaproteobacteria bacterium]